MKSNLRMLSTFVVIFLLLLSTNQPALGLRNSTVVFTTISFVPNIETMGVAVSGTGLSSTAELSYRQTGETFWHTGHPLMRIPDGRLIGSLFNLLPATSYDIKVIDGSSEIQGSATTQSDELSFTPSTILYVDDGALPGGNGSAAAPFKTIQAAVNQANPGTQVLVADGVYREAITFPRSGAAGNWIQVKAAGNAALLDSADRLSGSIWTLSTVSHVYFTKISGPVAYLARDGKRYYQYDDKTGLMQSTGHAGVTINEGWYYDPSTLRLYIRSADNPAGHTWQLPRLNHAFDLNAHDWIWIEGFQIQFYGTTTNGCGVCTLNASHLVIRKNKIRNMQLGIFINWTGTNEQGNDTRIEQNEVYDPLVNEFPWKATKGSYMEGTGIIIRGHIGAIVRDNNVHNFFNGIYTGSSGALENPALAFDADIYDNQIHDISDDALEPEGAAVNQRFRNNIINRTFVGISVAPITQGPAWVLRNVFTNITGRGIKFADSSDGIVLIYHNTAWTAASAVNGADLITAISHVKMRNNIFQVTNYSIYEVPTGSTANDWDHDNWYTTRGSTGPHFKWENVNYNTISALCTARGLECNGYENPPGFTNAAGGDFTLLPTSPNIDQGIVIPGVNDNFVGNAPDVGAYEFVPDLPPTVLSSTRIDPNPTSMPTVNFKVTFSEPVTGVDLIAPFGDFRLSTTSDVTGAAILSVTPVSSSIYIVSVNTGTGAGTIRLDVLDDNSIKDATNNPLGGATIGDGDFTGGEAYTISPPNVDVKIGTQPRVGYYVPPATEIRTSYAGVNNGPVQVESTNASSLIPSVRVIFNIKSYSEMMGLPVEQLSQEYWFPTYNNATLNSQLRVGNLGNTSTVINVYLGNTQIDSYTLAAGGATRKNYTNYNGGPLRVTSSATKILSTIRLLYNNQSFSELMGLPKEQLTTSYLFPYYNNVAMTSNLQVSNVGDVPTTINVYLGTQQIDTFSLAAKSTLSTNYSGQNSGPLKVTSSAANIVPSLRVLFAGQSYSEMIGYPADKLTNEYWYPVYDNVTLNSQLRVSNVGTGTTTITVYLGAQQIDSYRLAAGAATRKNYFTNNPLNGGPLHVVSSSQPILSTVRELYTTSGFSSFYEMMGLPKTQLSTQYYFPWYNNVAMNSELRLAAP